MREKVWTVSNILSYSRVVLIVPYGFCLMGGFDHHREWAALLIVAAIATDYFDGYLARRLHQVTDVGKIADPVADKICVGTVGLMLAASGDLPFWFIAAVVVRDLLIVVGGIQIGRKKRIVVQSNWPGKITVALLSAVLVASTLRSKSLEMFRAGAIWASVVMMAFSLLLYTQRLFIGRGAGAPGEHRANP